MHFVSCKTVRKNNRNREKIRKFCLEEKKLLHRETQLTGTQYEGEQDRPNERIPESSNIPARTFEEGPNEDRPGTSYMASNQPTQHQAGPYTKTYNEPGHQGRQAIAQKGSNSNSNSQKRRNQRKRKALSHSKKTTRPTKNKTSLIERKSKEAAIAQIKITLARKRQLESEQKQHPLTRMVLSSLNNSKTIEIINLASDSSTSTPMRIVTSSSPKDLTESPKKTSTTW